MQENITSTAPQCDYKMVFQTAKKKYRVKLTLADRLGLLPAATNEPILREQRSRIKQNKLVFPVISL